jgi:hypothetical protein
MLVPKSSLSWLSFSSAEVAQARDLIRSLKEEGVLDELGFLALTAAFADRFYPATSTIMTRSRYLFLVPAAYRHIEHRRDRKRLDIGNLARELQDQLRAALAENERVGVIGRDAKARVQRPPSNVYWASLQELQIFRWEMSERAYQQDLSGETGGTNIRDDDKAAFGEESEPAWDPGFPILDLAETANDFPKSTSFALRPREARELTKRWSALDAKRGLGPCLLSHLVDHPEDWWEKRESIELPWNARGLSPALRTATDHARCVSLFARGAVLQYYELLLNRRETLGLARGSADMRAGFSAWWTEARDRLRRWEPTELRSLLLSWGKIPRPADMAFIEAWRGRLLAAATANALFDDTAARKLIAEREHQQRPRKGRLRSRTHLLQWRPPARNDHLYQLDYRHPVGFQFAKDIVAGSRGHHGS